MSADQARVARAPDDHRGFQSAVYIRIATLLATIEKSLGRTAPIGPIYKPEALAHRLLQEVAFLLDTKLRCADADRALRNLPPLIQDQPTFYCGGLRVDSCTGRVRPSLRLFISSVGKFLALWLAILGLGAVATLSRGKASGGTIVFGVPEEGLFRGDDSAFAEFAKRGPVTPFTAARLLFVQALTPGASSTDARILYARHPLFALLHKSPMRIVDFLLFSARHLGTAGRFLATTVRFPLLAILWRDFGLHAAVDSLNERGLIQAVVLTNSNWHRQLLWMTDLPHRRFAAHIVFYSQHDRPAAYVDIEENIATFPSMRLLRAQHFWVWTRGHADLLLREGIRAQMHVAGPILWEVVRRDPPPAGSQWISVFDITPLTARATRDLGLLGNYYSTENMLAFLDGIEAAASQAFVDLPLVIKPKRSPTGRDDPRYLSRRVGDTVLRWLAPTTSALSVVANSAAIIVYPYSTVAYIADWLGVPAIYFDPTGKLAATYETGKHIHFARSTQELAAELRAVLENACPAS